MRKYRGCKELNHYGGVVNFFFLVEQTKVPLTTVRNYRGGKELNHYGGVVYALKERTDIKDITDLKDKVFF